MQGRQTIYWYIGGRQTHYTGTQGDHELLKENKKKLEQRIKLHSLEEIFKLYSKVWQL